MLQFNFLAIPILRKSILLIKYFIVFLDLNTILHKIKKSETY